MIASVKRFVLWCQRPIGSTKPEMPVFADRATAMRFSIARITRKAACWYGANDRPNQASLVMFTRNCAPRSEEHTSELQSHSDLVCRLLLEKKKKRHATIPVRETRA